MIKIQARNVGVVLPLVCMVIGILCLYSLQSQERSFIFSLGSSGKELGKLCISKKQVPKSLKEKFCDFSAIESDICDINGDIRIYGPAASINLIDPHEEEDSRPEENTVRIRPYPFKDYPPIMEKIGEIRITSRKNPLVSQECNVNHSVPAIIFSNEGFHGNFFHDFTDCLIPLFITSRQFNGEIQFAINNMKPAWVNKYRDIFRYLSNYELINLKDEQKIHCYPRAIINLYSQKSVPSRAPNNYSLTDFVKTLRTIYSLDREVLTINTKRKPRLLLITRKRAREFTNAGEIISMAESLGYEVVAQETECNVTNSSKFVNSFDVMIGVQGAGLMNLMFLPDNAILIQVVPLGKLDAREHYGLPAINRNLRYLQYDISIEESTLSENYLRDHVVFTDPESFRKEAGWWMVYMFGQNVKVNITRFKPLLVQALELLTH